MMGDKVTKALIFLGGAAIGSAVTWKLVKTKYEEMANDEIREMREYYSRKEEEYTGNILDEDLDETTEAETVKVSNKPSISEYASKLSEEGYTDYSASSTREVSDDAEDEDVEEDKPYVISPDEFGMFSDYDQISLTWYADHFLADDNDELVDDVEEKIGWDAIDRIGEYEDDAIHVRNDKFKADYEILRDLRKYREVIGDAQEE